MPIAVAPIPFSLASADLQLGMEDLTQADIQAMVQAADVDGDGEIDLNEFRRVLLPNYRAEDYE